MHPLGKHNNVLYMHTSDCAIQLGGVSIGVDLQHDLSTGAVSCRGMTGLLLHESSDQHFCEREGGEREREN